MYISVCFVHYPPVITDTTVTIYENDSVHVCPYIYDVNNLPLVISNTACTPIHGTVTFTSDSCFEFVPDTGWTGIQNLCIVVCDTMGACDTGTVRINVLPLNVPPIAQLINLSTCINTSVGVNVASATTDPHGNPLTYSYGTVIGPNGYSLQITGSGAIVFAAAAPGVYRIPYTVCNHSPIPVYSLCSSNYIVIRVKDCGSGPHNPSIDANNDAVVTMDSTWIHINELANDYYPYTDSLSVSVVTPPHLPGSTFTINPDGTINYYSPTPGNDTIVYSICDPAPLCDTALIVIVVDSLPLTVTHYPPVAVDDFDSTLYYQPVTVPVLNNDHSPDGDSIHVVSIPNPPVDGTATINPDGTITYVPGPNADPGNPDTFTYQICDVTYPTKCDTATVVIYIIGANVPPIAQEIDLNLCNSKSIGINVYSAATDPHGNPLTFSYGNVTGPGAYSLQITGLGAIVFAANTPGTYTIPYTVCNHSPIPAHTLCSSNVVVVHVLDCSVVNNDSINANNDAVVTHDSVQIHINELANDFYPNPGSLSVSILTPPHLPGSTYTVNPDGTVNYYSPTPGNDTIVYAICDPAPLCDTAIIVIVVDSTPYTVTHYPPVAVDDFDSTVFGTPVIVPVLNNDHSPDGDSVHVVSVPNPPTDGTATINPDGTITYVPGPNAGPGNPDTFTYQICDNTYPTLCDTATVVITVGGYNVPPIAQPIRVATCWNTPIGVNVAAATTDPHGNPMTYTYGPVPNNVNLQVTGNGAVVVSGAVPGTFVIPYTVCNHSQAPVYSLCASSYIVVRILDCTHGGNDSIDANNDGVVTHVSVPTHINELANDFYPNPGSLNVSVLTPPHLPGATYTVNPDGTINYTSPTAGIDTIVYSICDPAPLCDTATIVIYVDTNSVTHYPPVAVDDFDSTSSHTPVTIPVLNNDHSPSGDSIHVVTVPCTPTEGTAVINPDGTITYTPDSASALAYPDTFCYTICDVVYPTLCDTATVVVYFNQFYVQAANDTEYICKGDVITIPVLHNDRDPNGTSHLVITGTGSPVPGNLGDVTNIGTDVITFASNGTPGTVKFDYYVCDNQVQNKCDTATVLIHINNCPKISIDTIYDTTFVNTPDTVCVAGHVHAVGTWNISSLCTPQHGGVVINGQCFTYTPNQGYFGNDTFCMVVCDSLGCDTSEVIITVLDTLIKGVPEACDLDSTVMNVPLTIDVLANDIVPAAADTAVTLQSTPVNGTAVVNANHTVTYTPNANYTGSEQFSYMVCAITGTYKYCDTAYICVTVVDTTHRCFVPNAYSPNGDGVNDKFVIPCNDEYPKAELRVFDRWGVEVWRSHGHYLNDWDGHNQQGTVLPDGTYYAIYEYNDGTRKNEAKFVVIHR
jgi:gliding motility-associated-like protein